MNGEQTRPAIRVAVAAPYPAIVSINDNIAEYADEIEVCGTVSSPDTVFEQVRLMEPDVLLLSEELGLDRPDTLARLNAVVPGTRLVVMTRGGARTEPVIADSVVGIGATATELRDAIRAAARLRIPDAAPPAHARPEVDESGRVPSWLRVAPDVAPAAGVTVRHIPAFSAPLSLVDAAAQPIPGEDGPPDAEDASAARTPAKVVLVFSGKGGVGASIIAANLATSLAVRGAAVAMVDLNLQFGDLGVLLHLESHPSSIDTVARHGPEVDAAVLEGAMATSADGVRVLLAPSSPESGDLVTPSLLEAILNHLVQGNDVVVVDSPAHLDERVVGVMEVADHVLLVSSSAITSVKDAKMTLKLLQSLGIGHERVAVVLNQPTPRISLPAAEIERALRFPLLASLPHEPRMEASVDAGRPLVLSEPRGGFSQQIAAIAAHVARSPDGGPARTRRHAKTWRLRFGR